MQYFCARMLFKLPTVQGCLNTSSEIQSYLHFVEMFSRCLTSISLGWWEVYHFNTSPLQKNIKVSQKKRPRHWDLWSQGDHPCKWGDYRCRLSLSHVFFLGSLICSCVEIWLHHRQRVAPCPVLRMWPFQVFTCRSALDVRNNSLAMFHKKTAVFLQKKKVLVYMNQTFPEKPKPKSKPKQFYWNILISLL